jgi:hypothetical protein
VQQLTTSPGNAGTLLNYLRHSTPGTTVATGLRAVGDEFGKLPSYPVGAKPPGNLLLPMDWPPAAIAVGLLAFAAAVVVAALRRRAAVLWLAALAVAVAAAGVVSVAHIDGLPFLYVTRWTAVIGMLAGITTGLGLLPELAALARRPAVLAAPVAGLAVAATVVTAVGTARAETPQTDYTGGTQRLEQAALHDLEAHGLRIGSGPGSAVVRVDFAPTTRKDLVVGTSFEGSGLVLGLVRDGVDVQVSRFWQLPFGERRTARVDQARYLVTLAYADGTSPPPGPGQRVLAVAGEYQVYGGLVAPTG